MMKFIVTKEFTFDSAHFLQDYNGKCENLHGHTYKLQVSVEGARDESGLVIDFVELKKIVNEKIIDKLDHTNLNDVLDVNPSAENIVEWIWNTLSHDFSTKRYHLYAVKLWETPTSFAEFKNQGSDP